MKSIAPVCGVSEITRAILKHHYRFDYNPLAKIDLTSISTAFQSYLNDERLCAINPDYDEEKKKKISALRGIEPWTARSEGQQFTHWATGTPVIQRQHVSREKSDQPTRLCSLVKLSLRRPS